MKQAAGVKGAEKALADAGALVQRLRGEIRLEIADYYRGAEQFWPCPQYDRYRWLIARRIMNLQEALGKRTAEAPPAIPLRASPMAAKEDWIIKARYSPAPASTLQDTVRVDAGGNLLLDPSSSGGQPVSPQPKALTVQLEPRISYLGERTIEAHVQLDIPTELVKGARLLVELLDNGRIIRSSTLKSQERRADLSLNVAGLPEGTYVVRARILARNKQAGTEQRELIIEQGPF